MFRPKIKQKFWDRGGEGFLGEGKGVNKQLLFKSFKKSGKRGGRDSRQSGVRGKKSIF